MPSPKTDLHRDSPSMPTASLQSAPQQASVVQRRDLAKRRVQRQLESLIARHLKSLLTSKMTSWCNSTSLITMFSTSGIPVQPSQALQEMVESARDELVIGGAGNGRPQRHRTPIPHSENPESRCTIPECETRRWTIVLALVRCLNTVARIDVTCG